MITLIKTPQRADFKADYQVDNDILTIRIGETEEIFDFTGLEEGVAKEIIVENLPAHPIESAKKENGIITIVVRRFYDKDEKELFENGAN